MPPDLWIGATAPVPRYKLSVLTKVDDVLALVGGFLDTGSFLALRGVSRSFRASRGLVLSAARKRHARGGGEPASACQGQRKALHPALRDNENVKRGEPRDKENVPPRPARATCKDDSTTAEGRAGPLSLALPLQERAEVLQ
jgi:hypothetical protein